MPWRWESAFIVAALSLSAVLMRFHVEGILRLTLDDLFKIDFLSQKLSGELKSAPVKPKKRDRHVNDTPVCMSGTIGEFQQVNLLLTNFVV